MTKFQWFSQSMRIQTALAGIAIATALVAGASCVYDDVDEASSEATSWEQDALMAESWEVAGCGTPVSQVPNMTGTFSPSGAVTRSGVYSSSYEGWRAFNSDNASWLSKTWESPAWLAYEWDDGPRIITSYAIKFTNGSLTSRAPRDWTLQGFTGSSWTTVDTRTNQTNWAGVETRSFTVANPGSYSKYRLHVTRDNDNRSDIVVVSIAHLDLIGTADCGPPTTGMSLWLRADQSIATTDGRVATWIDQSGNGRHGSQSTISRRPVRVSNALNGQPIVRFDGAQSMQLSSELAPNQFTVFAVGRNRRTNSFSMILGPGGSTPNNQLRWEGSGQLLLVGTSNGLPVIRSNIGNNGSYHSFTGSYNGSTLSVYRDGGFVSSHNFTTTGPWRTGQVGAWYNTHFLLGDLAEIIVYDRALSSSERQQVEDYLANRYALP